MSIVIDPKGIVKSFNMRYPEIEMDQTKELPRTIQADPRVKELKGMIYERLRNASPDQLLSLSQQFAEEQVRLERQLAEAKRLAVLDPLLTKLFNHKYFLELLVAEFKTPQKVPTSALILMDLDRFGMFNKEYGQSLGDELLQIAQDAIVGSMRRGDSAGRVGGDEFGLIVRRTNMDGAVAATRRIQTATINATEKRFGKSGWSQTISAGVCMIDPNHSFDLLRGASDQALIASKQAGKDRISIASIDPTSRLISIIAAFSNTPATPALVR